MEASDGTCESEGYHTQEFESDDASTVVDWDDYQDAVEFGKFLSSIAEALQKTNKKSEA